MASDLAFRYQWNIHPNDLFKKADSLKNEAYDSLWKGYARKLFI